MLRGGANRRCPGPSVPVVLGVERLADLAVQRVVRREMDEYDVALDAAGGTPTSDALKMLVSWAASQEQLATEQAVGRS